MKLTLEVLCVLALFGTLVFVLAWLQSKLDRALEESRRAGVGFFDAEPGPPEPPAGNEPSGTNPRRSNRWGAEFEAMSSPPSGQKRKPFLCLDQHPYGWICGLSCGHDGDHGRKTSGDVGDWPQWPKKAISSPRPISGPVGAKTALQDAPRSPNATLPATSVPPESADIPPRRKP